MNWEVGTDSLLFSLPPCLVVRSTCSSFARSSAIVGHVKPSSRENSGSAASVLSGLNADCDAVFTVLPVLSFTFLWYISCKAIKESDFEIPLDDLNPRILSWRDCRVQHQVVAASGILARCRRVAATELRLACTRRRWIPREIAPIRSSSLVHRVIRTTGSLHRRLGFSCVLISGSRARLGYPFRCPHWHWPR